MLRGALGDVQELLVAGREKEARRGAVAVADDGQPGRGHHQQEQRRDVDPEPELPPAGAGRPRGGALRHQSRSPGRTGRGPVDRMGGRARRGRRVGAGGCGSLGGRPAVFTVPGRS